MSKELRFTVSEALYSEVTEYVSVKKRAGEMMRSEMAHFLRDAVRHEIDRYPLSGAAKAGAGRKRGRPPKKITAVLPELLGGNSEGSVPLDSSLAARAQGIELQEKSKKDMSTWPPLAQNIEAAFLSKLNPADYRWQVERPAVKRIVKRCLARPEPEAFALAMVTKFWELVSGGDPWMAKQPFMPRILAGKLWDQVAKLVEAGPVRVVEVAY